MTGTQRDQVTAHMARPGEDDVGDILVQYIDDVTGGRDPERPQARNFAIDESTGDLVILQVDDLVEYCLSFVGVDQMDGGASALGEVRDDFQHPACSFGIVDRSEYACEHGSSVLSGCVMVALEQRGGGSHDQ
jgi:hypothetical protein